MNNTKWDELRLAMYNLDKLCPKWRTRDIENGYVSQWDAEWFYHFCEGGYSTIEWVEIRIENAEQEGAVLKVLKAIHVPGHRIDTGFRVYGYTPDGTALEYI